VIIKTIVLVLAVLSASPSGFAAQTAPLAPDQLLKRIQALVQAGDLAAAEAELATGIKNHPADPLLHNFQGVVSAQQGKYREAEASFLRSTKAAPEFAPALENLGRLYQENKGTDPKAAEKAIATYTKLLALVPGHADAHYQVALLYHAKGAFRDSLSHLDQLPNDVQDRPQALALRCAVEAGLGNTKKADQLARQLAKAPDLEEADVALVLPSVVKPPRQHIAVLLLEALVERKLASPGSLQQLAALYEADGKLAEARQAYEKSATSSTLTAELLLDLARIAYKHQDFEGALSYLAHARDLKPKDPGIHFFFGMVCIEMDLPVDAEKSLRTALDLNPGNPYYNYALGSVLANGRKWKEAIPYFEKYCVNKSDDPRGKLALASAHFHNYEIDLARKELMELVDNPQTAAGAHHYLGLVAIQESNFPEAVRHLEEAVRISPDYAEAHAELGFAQMELERYEEARKALDRAIALDPDSRRANRVLLSLYQRTEDPRAEAQAERFREVDKKLAERAKMLLRAIDARPYP
jgi:tetratricopeptide (TPR) repeat protein